MKNLGFRLDSKLTLKPQLTALKSSYMLKLRNISRIKSFLSNDQIKVLVLAIVISTIDYCNALYYRCPGNVIDQLQVIQNRACRIIFGLKKKESVEEKLQSLHWLKVKERIEFKLLMLIYKALHNAAPTYISELLTPASLDSRNKFILHTGNQKSNRAFKCCAPVLWNSLPNALKHCDNLQTFKSGLKTHLFGKSFNLS